MKIHHSIPNSWRLNVFFLGYLWSYSGEVGPWSLEQNHGPKPSPQHLSTLILIHPLSSQEPRYTSRREPQRRSWIARPRPYWPRDVRLSSDGSYSYLIPVSVASVTNVERPYLQSGMWMLQFGVQERPACWFKRYSLCSECSVITHSS